MKCPACGKDVIMPAVNCPHCGMALPAPKSVPDFDLSGPGVPAPSSARQGPFSTGFPPANQPNGNTLPQFPMSTLPAPNVVDTLVPSKNPNALISYYIGLFSIMPIVGVPMGIAAVVLGIRGLKECKRNPAVRGKTHAWVGIITGTLFGGIWLLLTIGLIILFLQRPR